MLTWSEDNQIAWHFIGKRSAETLQIVCAQT
jgi:hypothetical protein